MWTLDSHIFPAQKGFRASRLAVTDEFRRWIQVQPQLGSELDDNLATLFQQASCPTAHSAADHDATTGIARRIENAQVAVYLAYAGSWPRAIHTTPGEQDGED